MIVQAHDPAGTRRARIALVAGWLLSLAATWLIASYLAAPGLFDMRQRLTQAESERDRSRDRELEQERARSSASAALRSGIAQRQRGPAGIPDRERG